MNRTYTKSSSALYPCPPMTGIGYMNDTGTLYLICSEMFYDPTNVVEAPMSSTTIALAVSLAVFLSILIVCGIAYRNSKRSYAQVYAAS